MFVCITCPHCHGVDFAPTPSPGGTFPLGKWEIIRDHEASLAMLTCTTCGATAAHAIIVLFPHRKATEAKASEVVAHA